MQILRAMAEPRRLYEQISQQLAKAIASGEYELGQRLPSERELAQSFGVSRPTVREAIIALELDGLVEVRLGSGVYVTSTQPPSGTERVKDIGPFELLEARRAIEGEAAALAAVRIDDEQLKQLSELIAEMRDDNRHNEILMSEEADRRFHELIASSTQNSGLIAAVQMLWDARARSPQSHSLDDKGRARGLKPPIEEHAAIVAPSSAAIRKPRAPPCTSTFLASWRACSRPPRSRKWSALARSRRRSAVATPR
jgi:DNA-binding FadR family transcriptional regulator